MLWEEKSLWSEYLISIPCIHAKEIVYDVYLEGYINWITLIKVIEKINTSMNGSWMFKKRN